MLTRRQGLAAALCLPGLAAAQALWHYRLIKEAMREKLLQNSEVKRILLATGNLILKPDHHNEGCQAPEWKYYELWMELRAEFQ